MQLSRNRSKRRLLGLTPIIDVVFLLLLFFMLASTFSRYSSVAVAVGGRSAPAPAAENAPIILLSVKGDGVFAVNGTAASLEAIGEALIQAAPDNKARIIVRPATTSSADDIVHAIERARETGLGPVILAR